MHDHAQIRDWLKLLAGCCRNTISTDELQAKLGLYAPMLAAEFPNDGWFCPASLREVAAHCTFFPSYAELCEQLRAWQKSRNPYPIYGEAAGQHAIEAPTSAWNTPLPEKRGAQSDDERHWASETVRSVSAQLAEIGEAKQDALRPPPKAMPLNRAQLVEAYKRAGVKGPQLPEPQAEVLPLRSAAALVRAAVRRGPVIDAEPHDA
jgi:hypothetical protein